MPVQRLTPAISVDPSRVQAMVDDLITVFQNHKPTIKEILLALGNLGYALGASIEGYKEKGPSEAELVEAYKRYPRVGTALMLQSIQVCGWLGDLAKTDETLLQMTREEHQGENT